MPRASLFESAHAARRLWVPTAVVRDRGGARGAGRGHSAAVCRGTSVGTSAPSTKVIFAGGRGQIHGARRVSCSGLQAAPAATRTSPGTLGAGPRAGSSGAGHRASRGSVVQRPSPIQDELCPLLTSGLSAIA
jgi:hypothetical protein